MGSARAYKALEKEKKSRQDFGVNKSDKRVSGRSVVEFFWKSVYLMTGFSLGRARYTMEKGARRAFGATLQFLFYLFLGTAIFAKTVVAAILFSAIILFLLVSCPLVEESEKRDAQKKRML